MNRSYDVAVIGGGMVGASIAYQCAGRGLKTALFERRHLASGGSGGNFGLVLWSTGQPSVRFALDREYDGAARVARLPAELDFDLEYRAAHGHCLIATEEELALFSGHRDRFVAAGFQERIITPAELRREEPNLRVGPEVIAALQTDEAVLNPFRLVQGYWRQARRRGAQLFSYSPVAGFRRQGRRITHLVIPAGEIAVGQVVIAAGSWSRQVALMLDISLPEYFIQAEAVVTEPIAPFLRGFAYWGNALRVPAESRIAAESMQAGWESRSGDYLFGAYDFGAVQAGHGNMLFGQMTHITPALSDQTSRNLIPDSAREALRLFPQLGKLRIMRAWRSPAPFTPDHMPLVGRLGAYDNLLIASGFASAITQCPWAGEFIADLAAGGLPAAAARPFDPMRFDQPVAA